MRFYTGDLVKVKLKMPTWKAHFESGQYDIIEKVENGQVILRDTGGWYDFEELILIKRNSSIKLLNKCRKLSFKNINK